MADRLADGYIPPMGGERYLTDRDLARRLHVSRRTLQQYRHEGILPYFLFGGKTLYRESDIQKVLERNYRKAYRRSTARATSRRYWNVTTARHTDACGK